MGSDSDSNSEGMMPEMPEEVRKTAEQIRRAGQSVVEWLNEEFDCIPLLTKIQNLTGIPASF